MVKRFVKILLVGQTPIRHPRLLFCFKCFDPLLESLGEYVQGEHW